MDLLIVDDEALTREGLLSSVNWKKLGISAVFQAEDGAKGLELAKRHHPGLVLTDIRMPHMDGIQMAEHIQTFLPDTSIIFMSGYSDKAYLKAAIRLKAINYVEKPINPLEIEDTILDAIKSSEQRKRVKHSEVLHALEYSKHICLNLTYPTTKHETYLYTSAFKKFSFPLKLNTIFTTIIIKNTNIEEPSNFIKLDKVNSSITAFLSSYHLIEIHAIKSDQYYIYHIFGSQKPTTGTLDKVADFLRSQLDPAYPFFIAIGKTVTGIEQVYHSYSSAVILLQSSFFYEYNSVLSSNDQSLPGQVIFKDPVPAFVEALTHHDFQAVTRIQVETFEHLKNNRTLLPGQVKDIYYKLFMHIHNAYDQLQVSLPTKGSIDSSILDDIEIRHTLLELHTLLLEKSTQLIEAANEKTVENTPVFLIKDFIHKNYMHDSLSVKTISEHVYLSVSYVCTLFKTETGNTLNQYLTEYRIERAKQLLSNSRYKITDISSKVGYNDSNYFGKTFKKIVGLSPSEYKEKMLR